MDSIQFFKMNINIALVDIMIVAVMTCSGHTICKKNNGDTKGSCVVIVYGSLSIHAKVDTKLFMIKISITI